VAEVVRFVLRLSPALHEKLKALAAQEHRSLHGLILHVLLRYVDEHSD
jgi:predicted HicB family RNase H-like nuclease